MILIIDNYDSFTYNLYQYIGELTDQSVLVIKNDEMTLEEMKQLSISHIILSPGPKTPKETGICKEVVRCLGHKIPILGVCLGHQVIGEVFGSVVDKSPKCVHGKANWITVDTKNPLFKTLPNKILGARYHSLCIYKETLSKKLRIIASGEAGEIMAIVHHTFPIYGLQFHPESILTPSGKKIIQNFLEVH